MIGEIAQTVHGSKNEPSPAKKIGNIDPAKVSTNERVVYPWVWGEAVVPAHHVGEIYDQFTKDAPADRPRKK